MTANRFFEAMNQVGDRYYEEAQEYRAKTGQPKKILRSAVAACACLLLAAGVVMLQVSEEVPLSRQPFVPVSDLLAPPSGVMGEAGLEVMSVSVGAYRGVYEKVPAVSGALLEESAGSSVSRRWYRVSGHSDGQYLIQKGGDGWSLWKFMYFDSGDYPYRDVLEQVYGVKSAQDIAQITVDPANMDNTELGMSIQADIGSMTVTDREDIETLYEILCAMTCYGSGNWDRIDYGDVSAGDGTAVRQGRYLTLVTGSGIEIDSLKYTAVSDMFYEYSGVAYSPLEKAQAESVRRILGIETQP